MKLQSVSVIFALIVLPLILVLTYYIQLQVDTIEMQNEYDRKLLDSTYGAMSAFELNTANEDLSSVSDSLRTIIDASTNVFLNTLATNFGMSNASRTYLEPYIPAILYTLYDGYYISAPTRSPKFLVDSSGNAVTVGTPGVKMDAAGDFIYTEVHTSSEHQNNCTNCIKNVTGGVTTFSSGTEGHITYATYSGKSESQKAQLQIKFDDLNGKGKPDSYGQILYLKKGKTNVYTTNIDDAELEINHVLKTYMPYSARYRNGSPGDAKYFDISVVYTLDNYVTIQGSIGKEYYTKSGYFLPKDSVKVVKTKKDGVTKNGLAAEILLTYNQNDAKEFIESGAYVEIKIMDKINPDGTMNVIEGTVITSGGGKSAKDLREEQRILNNRYDKAAAYFAQIKDVANESLLAADTKNKLNQFLTETTYNYSSYPDYKKKLEFAKQQLTRDLNEIQYELDKMSAVTYYVTAEIFSDWIYNTLVDSTAYPVKEKNIIQISGQDYKLIKGKNQVSHDFSGSNTLIFDISGEKNKNTSVMEIAKDSAFYSHKLNVIRDSIQYNLNLSMTTYNNMLLSAKDYAMPVIQNEEWEKILNNVSIVSFMQGYNCGLKTYSNYKIVSSTNNEISILPEEIYYIEKSQFSDENTEYHRINCPKLKEKDDKSGVSTDYSYIAFISKDVKYDKVYQKTNAQVPYKYDHKNVACYECINDGNYKRTYVLDTKTSTNYDEFENLRRAYYIGVGKTRNNLYKMNAIVNSEGYEVIYDAKKGINEVSTLPLSKIKSIEIVLNTIKTHDAEENVLNYTVGTTQKNPVNSTVYAVVPNVATKTTLKVDVDPTISEDSKKVSKSNLVFNNLYDKSTAYKDDGSGNDLYMDKSFGERSTLIVKDSIEFIRIIYR